MKQNYNDIDAFIAKHLAQESSKEEEIQLQHWLSESEENRRTFEQAKWLWSQMQADAVRGDYAVDIESGLAEVKQRIKSNQRNFGIRRNWYLGMVAALACLVAAWFGFMKESTMGEPREILAATLAITDTLSDGSVLTLNQKSSVVLDPQFNKTDRRIRMQGEAYFKVSADKSKPFVVDVNDLEVKVVGTAFNIDAQTHSDRVTVTVFEGKVELIAKQISIFLTPGEAAIYDKTTQALTKSVAENQNVLAYQTKRFAFDEQPLPRVLEQLGSGYGVSFDLQNSVMHQCPLTARFDKQPLEQILEVLKETYGFQITREGDKITLQNGTCDGE